MPQTVQLVPDRQKLVAYFPMLPKYGRGACTDMNAEYVALKAQMPETTKTPSKLRGLVGRVVAQQGGADLIVIAHGSNNPNATHLYGGGACWISSKLGADIGRVIVTNVDAADLILTRVWIWACTAGVTGVGNSFAVSLTPQVCHRLYAARANIGELLIWGQTLGGQNIAPFNDWERYP